MDSQNLALDERCRGEVLILGGGPDCDSLVHALQKIRRVSRIVLVNSDWNETKKFRDDPGIEVFVDEFEDFLTPPVQTFDCAIILERRNRLDKFVSDIVPTIHTVVNRGWVDRSDTVFVDDIESQISALADSIVEQVALISTDHTFLKHLCTSKTKNDRANLEKSFFRQMAVKADQVTLQIVLDRYVDGWIEAFAKTAFFPGGTDRFYDFVDVQELKREL